jgi:PPP family 3-phenylpropionic acid transporter
VEVVKNNVQMQRWLSGLFGVSYLALGALMPFLALVLRDLGVEGLMLTAALGAVPLSRLVFGPVWSVLADRFSAPIAMVRIGATLSAIGGIALWLAPPGWWVVLAMLILAIGRAPTGPVLDSLTLRSLKDKREYGRVRRWGSVGFMVGVLGVGWLVDNTAYGPLQVVAVVSVLFLGLTLFMPSSEVAVRVEVLPALRRLVSDRFVRWMILAAAFHFAPHVGNTTFLAVHIDGLGHGAMWTGAAVAAGVIVEVLLMGMSARILGRFSAKHLLLVAMGLAIPRWALMVTLTSPWLIVALNMVHGITFGVFWLAAVALMSAKAPAEVATSGQGLLALAVGGFGSAMGVMGASWIAGTWDTTVMYQVATVSGVIALFCAVMAVRE